MAGHHGRPPEPDDDFARRAPDSAGLRAPEAFLRAAIDLLQPGRILGAGRGLRGPSVTSYVLSGLTVMADWIGSNRDWFPFTAPDAVSLSDYWAEARARATHALHAAGVRACRPAAIAPGAEADLVGLPGLRPMQRAVAEIALPDGPALALIEDLTGAGKTEAALILAQRMMQAGKAGGLYLALPTMATANALYGRLRHIAGRLFDDVPSLALAHGKSAQHDGFRRAIAVAPAPDSERREASCAHIPADGPFVRLLDRPCRRLFDAGSEQLQPLALKLRLGIIQGDIKLQVAG